jgi:hypothetical protein
LKKRFSKKERQKKENLLKARDASQAVHVVIVVAVVLSENNDLARKKGRKKTSFNRASVYVKRNTPSKVCLSTLSATCATQFGGCVDVHDMCHTSAFGECVTLQRRIVTLCPSPK